MPGPYSVASDSATSSRSGHTSPDSGGDFATSSIYSHARYTATSNSLSPVNSFGLLSETLSEEEIAQIESFYKGLHSHVYVCSSVAALYLFADGNNGRQCRGNQADPATRHRSSQATRDGLNRTDSRTSPSTHQQSPPARSGLNLTPSGAPSKTGWTLEFEAGVPVIVHVTRPGKRSIQFVFAERATGFPLWRDNCLAPSSGYTCIDSDYHEFRNDAVRVGLRFAAASAASKFLQQVVTLIANPATFSEMKKGRRSQTTPKKAKAQQPPKKSSISPPCCFIHRTHISKEDDLMSLAEFVDSGRKNRLFDNRASIAVGMSASKIYGTCRT